MQRVDPKVYLIGESRMVQQPTEDVPGLQEYLHDVGAEDWASDAGSDVELLPEVYGRLCYRSWAAGLNKNVTKVREGNDVYLKNVIDVKHGSVTEHSQVNFIFHNVSRVFCYAADHEVLTDEGWKLWPEVTGKEKFASLTADGLLVYEKAEEHFIKDYAGEMYRVRSEQVDLFVTPNHRMWVQPVDTQAARRGEEPFAIHLAKDILNKRVRYQKGGAKWVGKRPETFQPPGFHRESDRTGRFFEIEPFAKFLGFYLSEGCLGTHDTSINLYQNPGPVLDEMRETLVAMNLPVTEGVSGTASCRKLVVKYKPLYDWLAESCGGNDALQKRVPGEVMEWSPDLLSILLDAMVKGDGSVHQKNGHVVYYTSSKRLADDVQVIALKTGVAANVRVDDRTGESHTIFNGTEITTQNPGYIVSFLRASRLYPHVNHNLAAGHPNRWLLENGQNDQMQTYTGKVYCVKVPSGLLYVRRNGKPCWSGNTHELVRHRVGVAISQESLRYVRLDSLRAWLPTCFTTDEWAVAKFNEVFEHLEKVQLELAEHFKIDDMKNFSDKKKLTSAFRRLAPEGLATSIGWSANIRTLRFVLALRTHRSAEEEIRLVFDEVGKILLARYPNLFSDFQREEFEGIGEWTTPNSKI